jgi:glycosyltransferase involved in cell wall biosynthesis
MTRIAILHLLHHFAVPGIGRPVHVRVQYLGQRNFSWHIGALSGRGSLQEEFRHLGARVVDFSDRQNGWRNPIRRIRDYVVAHQIRIVHTHSVRTTLAAAVALAGLGQTIHLATEHLFYSPQDRRWGLFYTLMDRLSLYLPDHVITVSQEMYHQVLALPRQSPRRVTAIQNCVDCEAFYVPDQRDPCRSEFGLTPGSQVIGYVGRFEKQKRLDLLLEGFSQVLARHPDTRLLIVGEGWLRPKLEALAASLNISHAVIWTGFRDDVPRLLAAMDIYVQPSANEGLSVSILEAMAANKPVIVTDAGGTKEVVTNRKTGLLIPSGSASAIGSAIIDLLDHPEKRATLAQAGRSRVVQEFGVQRTVDAYQDLYQALALGV